MDLFLRIGLTCSDGVSLREAVKHFNISRDTVRKMLSYSELPNTRRTFPMRRPKLEPFIPVIDAWLMTLSCSPQRRLHLVNSRARNAASHCEDQFPEM